MISKTEPCALQPHRFYYISLVRSIVGQQLSIKAADSIYKKFTQYTGNPPQPEKILSAPDLDLRGCGLSHAKVKYVKDLSLKILNNELKLKGFSSQCDAEIIENLTQVKGIGLWTAQMFLIFTLGRLNVLPYLDLGVRNSMQNLYGLRKHPDRAKVENIAKKYKWEPYCSIASWYLWKNLDDKVV